MNIDHTTLRSLLEQLAAGELSKEAFDRLFTVIADDAQQAAVKAALLENMENEADRAETPASLERILQRILNVSQEAQAPTPATIEQPPTSIREAPTPKTPQTRRIPLWRKTAIAASIILALGTGVWLLVVNRHAPQTTATAKPMKTDVAPGGNKAVLTLANGSTIVLDNAANGTLAQQGSTTVRKTNNGQLAYNITNEKPKEILYNTLATPRGGQYQLLLPDGTKVWLNAASSIRYPTAFAGPTRQVDITGEAYFEIAKDAKMPFTVRLGSPAGARGEVKVLGTEFNVNAYDDEPQTRTTLVSGAVQVKKDAASVILKPGQQAQQTTSGPIQVIANADVEEALAWKNGKLLMRHTSMEAIMRQAARWYDVDVQFKDRIEEEPYTVTVPRSVPLSQLLKALEVASGAHFTIEGKTITITK